jgi:hypothetical protein
VAETEDEGLVQIGPGQSNWALAGVADFARQRCDWAAGRFVEEAFELSKTAVGIRKDGAEGKVLGAQGEFCQAAVHPDDRVIALGCDCVDGSNCGVEMPGHAIANEAVAGAGQLIQVQDECTHAF